jgi:sugar phosphate isomerase/epimerase
MNHNYKLSNISLSVYSFGYSAGFLNDTRETSLNYQNLTLSDIARYAKDLGLAGIEFPIDRYFPDPIKGNLEGFFHEMNEIGIKLIFDLENFTSNYLKSIAPYIAKYQSKFIRAKISRFYGGNRYKNYIYIDDKKEFYKNMDESFGVLRELDLKILVENHQDIVLNDIYDLISKYGEDRIGVTWDIGNSFPTGETPNSFVEKIGNHIGNIHLKDYKLFSCSEGYIMSRCELGKGVIDFQEIFKLLMKYGEIPMTIELGAFNCRTADINKSEYWDHSTGISIDEKNSFLSYINDKVINEPGWETPWEMGVSPEELAKIEKAEILNSVNYLSNLFNGNL